MPAENAQISCWMATLAKGTVGRNNGEGEAQCGSNPADCTCRFLVASVEAVVVEVRHPFCKPTKGGLAASCLSLCACWPSTRETSLSSLA